MVKISKTALKNIKKICEENNYDFNNIYLYIKIENQQIVIGLIESDDGENNFYREKNLNILIDKSSDIILDGDVSIDFQNFEGEKGFTVTSSNLFASCKSCDGNVGCCN